MFYFERKYLIYFIITYNLFAISNVSPLYSIHLKQLWLEVYANIYLYNYDVPISEISNMNMFSSHIKTFRVVVVVSFQQSATQNV